ncbi:ABC transporter permease [Tuwongella immobilis]|nr:ABC transporter permease subunit [Tuwongella immobilis]
MFWLRSSAIIGLLGILTLPPIVTILLALTPQSVLTTPLAGGISLRHFRTVLTQPPWPDSLGVTLGITTTTAILATILGTGYAVGLGTLAPRGQRMGLLLVLLPMAMPMVVLGIGLLAVFQLLGIWGQAIGLAIALAIPILPVVVLLVRDGLAAIPPELPAAARSLGATPGQVWWRVMWPLLRPTLVTALLMGWVLTLNEAILTQFLARPPESETVAKLIWPKLRYSLSPVIAAASTLLLLLSLPLVLILLRGMRPRSTPSPIP